MYKICMYIFMVMLVGCTSNKPLHYQEKDPPESIKTFDKEVVKKGVGLTAILGVEGSSVKLSEGVYLTASHQKVLFAWRTGDWYEHPSCDIALYKEKGATFKEEYYFGKIFVENPITMFRGYTGYSVTPKTTHGEYLIDFFEKDNNCKYSAATNLVVGGMSGGGVYNMEGKLSGITRGFLTESLKWEVNSDSKHYQDPASFVTITQAEEWLSRYFKVIYY